MSGRDFLMFVPGPVEIPASVRAVGAERIPYMRTEAFGGVHREVVAGLDEVIGHRGETALLTCSGTGGMESAVLSLFRPGDRVAAVNGGGFGERWVRIARLHGLEVDEIRLEPGADLEPDRLGAALERRPAGVLATAHETTTGQLFDVRAIGELVRGSGALLVVDAISSVCCDPYEMDAWGVDATVFSTQKGLALPPGMAFLALSDRAAAAARATPRRSFYLHAADYLDDGRRGQAPFTIAVGIMLQLQARLAEVRARGVEALVREHAGRARHFRGAIAGLPVAQLPSRPSNAVTALRVTDPGIDAAAVVRRLEEQHRIYVAPNPGPLRSTVFRVGHMGEQSPGDIDTLAGALRQVLRAGGGGGGA